jgi:hypothetical protein
VNVLGGIPSYSVRNDIGGIPSESAVRSKSKKINEATRLNESQTLFGEK